MNNKFGIIIGTMAAAAILGLGFSQSGTVQADPNLSLKDVRSQLQNQYPGEITELELDKEAKSPIYEVEIGIEGKEYELSVDGNTGEVLNLTEKALQKKVASDEKTVTNKESTNQDATELKFTEKPNEEHPMEEKENNHDGNKDDSAKEVNTAEKSPKITEEKAVKDDDNSDDQDSTKVTQNVKSNTETAKVDSATKTAPAPKTPKKAESNNKAVEKPEKPAKNAVIGESKAKSIALDQFSGNVEEIELDNDDGRSIYEVEIKNGNKEAEVEIDAYTGAVLVIEIDTDDDDDDD
ncbi:PepSY domain-containing protein [Oceanobacillus sp. CF4.6]|uniref:PepSY domain-containing protein n=1 Tax=Oceanobacillus sp. CF4.6 TaxID=3373080 RepID=UPI003EE727C1